MYSWSPCTQNCTLRWVPAGPRLESSKQYLFWSPCTQNCTLRWVGLDGEQYKQYLFIPGWSPCTQNCTLRWVGLDLRAVNSTYLFLECLYPKLYFEMGLDWRAVNSTYLFLECLYPKLYFEMGACRASIGELEHSAGRVRVAHAGSPYSSFAIFFSPVSRPISPVKDAQRQASQKWSRPEAGQVQLPGVDHELRDLQ